MVSGHLLLDRWVRRMVWQALVAALVLWILGAMVHASTVRSHEFDEGLVFGVWGPSTSQA